MEKYSPEKAYLEAKAIQGVAKEDSKKEPTAKELEEAEKKIDKIRAFDPAMIEALGESVILREKLGPELTAITLEIHKKISERMQKEVEQEMDKIFDDPANESADFKEILAQARPILKEKIFDKFFKEWEETIRNHKDFVGKEKVLDESLPTLKELIGKIVDNLLEQLSREI